REGEPSDGAFVILEGTVRVLVRSRDSRLIQLGVAGPGDTMGELGALDGGPRSATAVAETDVKALFLRREAFSELLLKHPEQALRLMRVLAARLRAADRQLVDLSSATLYVRLAKRLLELKDQSGAVLTVPMEQLAQQVGAATEDVATTLQGLEMLGG